MSWQGNECFVAGTDFFYRDCHEHMVHALGELLSLYGEKGDGWYILGNMDGNDDPDDFDPFEPTSYMGGPKSCFCWLPNPFMAPGVFAIRVRRPADLVAAAFECWDCHLDAFAYAGDGDEPLQRVEVYGEVYDMRPGVAA